MRPYAAQTVVTTEKSKAQIERLLIDFKATAFMSATGNGQAMIAFEMAGRRVKFVLPLPKEAVLIGKAFVSLGWKSPRDITPH